MQDPTSTSPDSIMPAYPWLLEDRLDLSRTQKKIEVMMMLGVPYTNEEALNAVALAEEQAAQIAAELAEQAPEFANLDDRAIIALVAYLQRLGTDISAEGDH